MKNLKTHAQVLQHFKEESSVLFNVSINKKPHYVFCQDVKQLQEYAASLSDKGDEVLIDRSTMHKGITEAVIIELPEMDAGSNNSLTKANKEVQRLQKENEKIKKNLEATSKRELAVIETLKKKEEEIAELKKAANPQ